MTINPKIDSDIESATSRGFSMRQAILGAMCGAYVSKSDAIAYAAMHGAEVRKSWSQRRIAEATVKAVEGE